jgi:hypothetical protein
MSYTLIERRELTEAASSVEFAGIPQTFTDLVVFISARSTRAANDSAIKLTFNSTGGTYTNRRLGANGATTYSDAQTSGGLAFANIPGAGNAANTFGNMAIYIPNYSGSSAKSFSTELVSENNLASTFVNLMFLFSYYVLIIVIYIYRRGSHEDLQAHDIDTTRRFFVCGVVGFGSEGAGAFA